MGWTDGQSLRPPSPDTRVPPTDIDVWVGTDTAWPAVMSSVELVALQLKEVDRHLAAALQKLSGVGGIDTAHSRDRWQQCTWRHELASLSVGAV